MSDLELILIAIGLSMDAFAVAVCKGLSTKQLKTKHFFIVGAWFGGFQALMPLIGYYLGTTFEQYITSVDHWIAFVLLVFLGAKMLKEGFSKEENEENASFSVPTMFTLAVATSIDALAVATSIDALAVGITFALLPDVNIYSAVSLIGSITFGLSFVGLGIGNVFGMKFKSTAEVAGGTILIMLGVKILLEHLGIVG